MESQAKHQSFSQAKGVLMTEYNVGLLQALILYHAPYFLSENEQERAMANMFLGTIVNVSGVSLGQRVYIVKNADKVDHSADRLLGCRARAF